MSLDATFYGFASLAEAKAAWKEQLARVAMEYVEAGVIVDALLGGSPTPPSDVTFATDADSLSALLEAVSALARGTVTSVMWQSTARDWFELKAPLVDETGSRAAACALSYVVACRANWRALELAIDACGSADAVIAIDLSSGWPSRACSAGAAVGDDFVLGIYSPGKPDAGEIIFRHDFTQRVAFGANFDGCLWGCTTDATSAAVLTVKRNGVALATVTYGAGSPSAAAVSGMSATTFQRGDVLTVHAPGAQDATLAGISGTLVGWY